MGGKGSGPSPTHTIEDAERVIALMERKRLPLIRAADASGLPLTTAYELVRRYPELAERLQLAQEAVADHYANGALEAVEDGVRLVLSPDVDAKRANAVASATRNLSDRRAWAARMLAPERYGDRVTHGGTVRVDAVVLLPQLAPQAPPASALARLAASEEAQAQQALSDGTSSDT